MSPSLTVWQFHTPDGAQNVLANRTKPLKIM